MSKRIRLNRRPVCKRRYLGARFSYDVVWIAAIVVGGCGSILALGWIVQHLQLLRYRLDLSDFASINDRA